jgi:hypothetical protein
MRRNTQRAKLFGFKFAERSFSIQPNAVEEQTDAFKAYWAFLLLGVEVIFFLELGK